MVRRLSTTLLLSMSLMMLTGCPGPGDTIVPDETSLASRKGEKVCIEIKDAQDYQPVAIAINLRGTSPKEKKYYFSPSLIVSDGELCIPPTFYDFKNGNKYIVEFILRSSRNDDESRSFVVGVGVNNNQVYNFPLSGREFARPYGAIEVSE
ncbi:putative T6SS immunity periplasmic lipoprotein [Enterobacter wuhouensis]|uniref:putative T6SS immunity periplasmic lipoprotein n=1 Tax=Enterobacter wuhouensis TaxID=2529381 RepID=UPI0035243F44